MVPSALAGGGKFELGDGSQRAQKAENRLGVLQEQQHLQVLMHTWHIPPPLHCICGVHRDMCVAACQTTCIRTRRFGPCWCHLFQEHDTALDIWNKCDEAMLAETNMYVHGASVERSSWFSQK